MAIVTKNFYAYGLPTGIVANKGIVYTNVQDGKQYVQQTVPYGSNWIANGSTNYFYYPTSGAVNSVTASTPLSSSGGTNPNLSIPKADATTDGYLSSADWNTFNSAGGVPTTRTINTTTPLQGGGDLSADRTLSIIKADATHNGYLSSTDWNTFNNKGSGTITSVGATSPITSSGGTTPTISTSMATNKLIGRSTAGTGVMEEISVGSGLSLSGGTLSSSANNTITHATASGTDTYTATIAGVTSYADGDVYLIRFTNGNTTGCTLNINGLGAVTMYRNNDGALIGGDIEDGGEMLCVYNSSSNIWQCIGTSPNSLIAYVTNAESISITKGQPVYAFGGVGDRLKVKLAYNTSDATSAQTIGLVLSASIGANQKGFIMMQGLLDGLSILPTSTWADGDPVYLGATAGSITNVKQYAPNHLVYLGFVTTASNGSAGRMYVRVQNGYELDELHNVQAQSPSNNDTIYYDSASNQWKTASIATILGYTPVATTTTINTTAPLSGGGDLSANRTLTISQATTSTNGYLSSTDWNTFNGKQTSPWQFRLSGKWWTPSNNALAIGSSPNVANSIRFSPFIVDRDITITQLGIAVVTVATAGQTCRVGIYSNNASTNQPSTRLVDSGTLAIDSTGTKTATGLSVSLTKGLYWFAYFSNASTGTIASIANLNLPDVIGVGASLQLGIITGYTQSLAYTSLPASASGLSNILSGASSYCVYYYY